MHQHAYNKSRTDSFFDNGGILMAPVENDMPLHGRLRDISACGLSSSSTRRGLYRLLSRDRLTAFRSAPEGRIE
jgi:hypothetical protein